MTWDKCSTHRMIICFKYGKQGWDNTGWMKNDDEIILTHVFICFQGGEHAIVLQIPEVFGISQSVRCFPSAMG